MKKFLFALLAVLFFNSCEDTQVNETALQAKVDDRLYISNDAKAVLNDDGSLSIQGFTQEESMTLQLSNLAEGTFNIGTQNSAFFEDFEGNIYSTTAESDGSITISNLDETNKTITGKFNFNAFLPGIDTLYVSNGNLYNVPYVTGEIGIGTFRAVVDGNPFVPVVISSRDNNNKILTSASNSNATMAISVPSDVTVGEYTLPSAGYLARYQTLDGTQTTLLGTIRIISHDPIAKTISGTFSFTTDVSEITEGFFNVNY